MTADADTTPPPPPGRGAHWTAGRIVLVVLGSIVALLGAALVPIAFPLLLQPGVVMLALAAGGDDVAGRGIGALCVALGVAVLAGALRVGERGEVLLAAGGRLTGALEVAVAVALAVDAVRDV